MEQINHNGTQRKDELTMKFFEINLITRENRQNRTVESTFKAELKITDELRFSEILDFMNSVINIWKEAMTAVKNFNFIEIEVTL